MRVIDRYLVGRLLGTFGLTALALVAIAWINRAILVIDRLLADGQSARVAVELTLLALPTLIRAILPLAVFVAAMITLLRMQADSELTVLRATGASPLRLGWPVVVFGLTIGALSAALVHVLGPLATARATVRQAEIAQTTTAALLRDGTFGTPVDGVTIFIASAAADGTLSGLMIADDRDPADRLTYAAAEAWLVSGADGPQLVMRDGSLQRLAEGRLTLSRFDDLAYDLSPFLPEPAAKRRNLRDVPTIELIRAPAQIAAETDTPLPRLLAQRTARLAEPALAPATALIAAGAVALGRFGRVRAWAPVVLGALGVIALHLLDTATLRVAEADAAWRALPLLAPTLGIGGGVAALVWAGRRA